MTWDENLWEFLRFSLFLRTLTILQSTNQSFYKIPQLGLFCLFVFSCLEWSFGEGGRPKRKCIIFIPSHEGGSLCCQSLSTWSPSWSVCQVSTLNSHSLHFSHCTLWKKDTLSKARIRNRGVESYALNIWRIFKILLFVYSPHVFIQPLAYINIVVSAFLRLIFKLHSRNAPVYVLKSST